MKLAKTSGKKTYTLIKRKGKLYLAEGKDDPKPIECAELFQPAASSQSAEERKGKRKSALKNPKTEKKCDEEKKEKKHKDAEPDTKKNQHERKKTEKQKGGDKDKTGEKTEKDKDSVERHRSKKAKKAKSDDDGKSEASVKVKRRCTGKTSPSKAARTPQKRPSASLKGMAGIWGPVSRVHVLFQYSTFSFLNKNLLMMFISELHL